MIITARIVNPNGKLCSDHILLEKEIEIPEHISQFGMNKHEQLQLLEQAQQTLLEQQTYSMNCCPYQHCPECSNKIWRNGLTASLFHGFYSEHQLKLSKWICSSPLCTWSFNPSISSYFGGNISPELVKAQAQLGADMPFRKGANSLKLLTGETRKIHNHMRVRQSTRYMAERLEKYLDCSPVTTQNSVQQQLGAKEIIVNVDGTHVHDADHKGHNFEAMVAKIYRPEHIIRQDKHHHIITEKQCIGSAKKDKQAVMKKNLLTAAKKAGLNQGTIVTGLADGAKNCWNIIKALSTHCLILLCILDWFHIGKHFKNVENQLPQKEKKLLDVAKKSLWRGHTSACLLWLEKIKSRLTQPNHLKKINALITYITNNQAYIVDYEKRKEQGQLFTSHVAESTVEHYAGSRLKKQQKMQWTRDGAHGILQLRGAMISDTWEQCSNDLLRILHFKKCA